MSWDEIRGNGKGLQRRAKTQWGKLTDDDLTMVGGNRDRSVGRIRERYGIRGREAGRRIRDFERRV